ncbi:MAG: PIN domain protein [Microgenomates bacterium OLB22]|nr:MAG: PIN domain protein [Microgenomates bacterium OLB22]
MNSIYIDTNIFLDLFDKSSSSSSSTRSFFESLHSHSIERYTSAETIQEIVYVAKKRNQLKKGIKIAEIAIKMVRELLPISKAVIEQYLLDSLIHTSSDSRDVIHLSAAKANEIKTIITYDKGFKKFKEIRALTPAEFLALV